MDDRDLQDKLIELQDEVCKQFLSIALERINHFFYFSS
jgi:hypothetical protein